MNNAQFWRVVHLQDGIFVACVSLFSVTSIWLLWPQRAVTVPQQAPDADRPST